MGTQTKELPKELAYAVVGAADVTVEKVKDAVTSTGRTARRARRKAEQALDKMERRGRAVARKTGPRKKRTAIAAKRTTAKARTSTRRTARTATRRVATGRKRSSSHR